jgi:alpha-mannosidase
MLKRLMCVWAAIMTGSLCYAQVSASSVENPKDYTKHVVGYAHIDLAWLWRWEESVHDIIYNTFLNQLNLMNAHPAFTFAQDQAIVYDMVEHYYPDIYKAIAEKVKTKNWIPVSSTWTQMDENMPDRESLVRQFLAKSDQTKIWTLCPCRLAAGRVRPPLVNAADCPKGRD